MRIAFAIRDRKNFIGGPAADAVRLLTLLRDRGHQIHVLGFWVGEEMSHPNLDKLIAAGISCSIVKKHRYTEDGVHWILEQLRDIRPDVFVAGLSTEGCFASKWLQGAGIPVINVLYGNDDVNLGRAIYFATCPPAWRISAHAVFGESLHRRFLSAVETGPHCVTVSGIVEIPELTARYPDGDRFSVVYAGRLVEDQKRVGALIQACLRLCSVYPHFEFHLIGDGVNGQRLVYETMVRDSGFVDRIHFYGILFGEEYFRSLAKYQVILLMSDSEGIPGAMIDGMATGLVPVCLRYPGVEDLIAHDETGLIIENRHESLEQAMQRLSTDHALWQRLSTNARESIINRFSHVQIVEKWETLLTNSVQHETRRMDLEIPASVKLPKKSALLVEDKRKPTFMEKVKRRLSRVFMIIAICIFCAGCNDLDSRISSDKDVALEYLKKPYLEKPFDAYLLDRAPDIHMCDSLLGADGVFRDMVVQEKMYRENLDSFYTVEFASFEYSRFLIQCLARLWKIAEQYRGEEVVDQQSLQKLYTGIIHYGKLELDRPGNRFQHTHSDYHIAAIAINMYFCLYHSMEAVRKEKRGISDLQRKTCQVLMEMGKESWTVAKKGDSTDVRPFQLARFRGHTWWINGNAIEFRPIYPCALMMHSTEMVDIIQTIASKAITHTYAEITDTAFWREGITPDGGSWTYGRQHRPWAYPYRGVRAVVQRMAEFRGTPWEISMTKEKAEILLTLIRGSSFYHYQNFIPPGFERQNFNYGWMKPTEIPSSRLARQLITSFPEHFTETQLEELKAFHEFGSGNNLFQAPVLNSDYTGSRYFFLQDDLIRKTKEYYVLINMASRRTDGVESALHIADYHNYFGADGSTFLMREGSDYQLALGAFEITSYPGVTARHGDDMLIHGRNLMGHCSMHNVAAGVVTREGSCAGFIFEKMRGLDKYKSWQLPDTAFENDQPWLYGVTAHKAYFWFGDLMVALGCGISNKRTDFDAEIRTTLDQRTFQGEVNVGGLMLTTTRPDTHIIIKPAGGNQPPQKISHHGFTYEIIPEQTPGTVHLSVQSRPTRWDALNLQNTDIPNKPVRAEILQIWIDHGKIPVEDTYGYIIHCNAQAPGQDLNVVMNTTSIQSVSNSDCTHIQAIFYQTDTLRCADLRFHVSAACAFSAQIQDDQLMIGVSDAKMDLSLSAILVTTNMRLADAKRITEGLYQVSIPLPTGKYRGKQGDASFAIVR